MRNYARFIPGEEIEEVEQWRFGAIDTAAQLLAAQVKARAAQADAAQTESALQQSYQAGFTAGLAQGRLQAQAALNVQMQDFLKTQAKEAGDRLAALFASAQQQLEQAEQAMAQDVLALACELARQVLCQELSVNRQAVLPVLHEALGLLGADCKTALVKLNPADLAALGEQIQHDFADIALNLRADPAVQRGGCVVASAGMVVDAGIARRWQHAVASLGLNSAWEVPDEHG
ncbi:MAG: flagellar assembly protein FliH [Ilumatobacteraceae bacterium]|jgi:flagellar assembly protein FliH|nr:flagellar assembly protein FliH [Ilumatobacteraceae bacterium]